MRLIEQQIKLKTNIGTNNRNRKKLWGSGKQYTRKNSWVEYLKNLRRHFDFYSSQKLQCSSSNDKIRYYLGVARVR